MAKEVKAMLRREEAGDGDEMARREREKEARANASGAAPRATSS